MDPITLLTLAVLAVLIFFMFRNSRKRQRDAAALQEKMVVGADVMTNSGVFGKILEIDEDLNQVLLETTPGTVLRLHRQTVSRVVEPESTETDVTENVTEDVVSDPGHESDSATRKRLGVDHGEPEFGQRLDDKDSPSSRKPNDD